jgi:hypothetical protein
MDQVFIPVSPIPVLPIPVSHISCFAYFLFRLHCIPVSPKGIADTPRL